MFVNLNEAKYILSLIFLFDFLYYFLGFYDVVISF